MDEEKTKLTKDDILAVIKEEDYTVLNDGRTTICQLTRKVYKTDTQGLKCPSAEQEGCGS